jgi:hypothetical protein
MSALLPDGFAALEPFAADWAISGTAKRAERRSGSNAAERRAFFEAGKERIPEALTYLDTKPLHALDAADRRLMDLVLCFAHIAIAVEVQSDAEERHAGMCNAMRITRAIADQQT